MDFSGQFTERIQDETDTIQGIVDSVPKSIRSYTNRIGVKEFWPELKKAGINRPTNLPFGYRLFDVLPYGDTPVIDLRPESEDMFISRTGMTFGGIRPFVKAGLVIPVLYGSDPKEWTDVQLTGSRRSDLDDLIARSYFHKARINAFLRSKVDRFDVMQAEVFEDLLRFEGLPAVVRKGTAFEAVPFSRGNAAQLASNISYFNAFDPIIYQNTMDRLEAIKSDTEKLPEFLKFVSFTKWLAFSEITASLGGIFAFAPMEETVDATAPRGGDVKSSAAPKLSPNDKEMWEWVFRRITGAFEVETFQDRDANALIEFLSNNETKLLKNKINAGIESLYAILQEQEKISTKEGISVLVENIEELVQEYRERAKQVNRLIDNFDRGSDHARYSVMGLDMLPLLETVSGYFTTPAAVIGIVKYVAKSFMGGPVERVKSHVIAHKLKSPNALRMLKFDDALKRRGRL
ncbi:hypothetical protein [Roseibium album]|uniref:Uncharacterized protein n=1 Tax=Roseibium album TaxID=311410 RepID=A0A0M7ARB7_9HYPH|nr:hypothetical protein [Roseibium album]CTQ62460.1 hypothetical protein LA5094_05250 [Roseibium album]CTQ77668.1 hypothetical protein LA5095_03975 [Roseibium album]CTQ79674.1 hypothetical protein LA5096_06322 [Roseibium album]